MTGEPRRYKLRKRAETMASTRLRITEAAVDLHGSVGPARTTITAVAERAGVQRHTVYSHFPTDEDLFAACSTHFFSEHPWPDPRAWQALADPARRLTRALGELYAYYESTEAMLANALRDEALVPAVVPALEPFRAFLTEAVSVLSDGWGISGRRRRALLAATRHVVDFETWRSLVRGGGIGRSQAVELAAAMVERAAVQASAG